MKKTLLILPTLLVLISSTVLADTDMMGYGFMGGGMLGMGLLGLLYFAIGAFIFSVIFWWTHNWMVKGKKR